MNVIENTTIVQTATPRFEDSDPGVGIMGGDAVITCAADESDISFYSRWERGVCLFF